MKMKISLLAGILLTNALVYSAAQLSRSGTPPALHNAVLRQLVTPDVDTAFFIPPHVEAQSRRMLEEMAKSSVPHEREALSDRASSSSTQSSSSSALAHAIATNRSALALRLSSAATGAGSVLPTRGRSASEAIPSVRIWTLPTPAVTRTHTTVDCFEQMFRHTMLEEGLGEEMEKQKEIVVAHTLQLFGRCVGDMPAKVQAIIGRYLYLLPDTLPDCFYRMPIDQINPRRTREGIDNSLVTIGASKGLSIQLRIRGCAIEIREREEQPFENFTSLNQRLHELFKPRNYRISHLYVNEKRNLLIISSDTGDAVLARIGYPRKGGIIIAPTEILKCAYKNPTEVTNVFVAEGRTHKNSIATYVIEERILRHGHERLDTVRYAYNVWNITQACTTEPTFITRIRPEPIFVYFASSDALIPKKGRTTLGKIEPYKYDFLIRQLSLVQLLHMQAYMEESSNLKHGAIHTLKPNLDDYPELKKLPSWVQVCLLQYRGVCTAQAHERCTRHSRR